VAVGASLVALSPIQAEGTQAANDQHPALNITHDQDCLPQYLEKCKSYNAGYRAGRLEAFSDVVDIYGVTDSRVLKSYKHITEVMQKLGETK
jgi:hypothetical protein